jgi:hypothetical protein
LRRLLLSVGWSRTKQIAVYEEKVLRNQKTEGLDITLCLPDRDTAKLLYFRFDFVGQEYDWATTVSVCSSCFGAF